jgi:hypothetical protein
MPRLIKLPASFGVRKGKVVRMYTGLSVSQRLKFQSSKRVRVARRGQVR